MEVVCKNCGSIDDYHTIMKSGQKTAWCNGCGSYIKNIPQGGEPVFHFGKYKGTLISEITDLSYLNWVLENTRQSQLYRYAIQERIRSLRESLGLN